MPVDLSAVARVVGIETKFVDLRGANVVLLPQQVALIGSGTTAVEASPGYSTLPVVVTTSKQVGDAYGYGSPLHLASLELLPSNGDGLGVIPLTVYPLSDATGTTAAEGLITMGAASTQTTTKTYTVTIAGITTGPIELVAGIDQDAAAAAFDTAINAALTVPVTSAAVTNVVTLTAKSLGAWGDDISVVINGTIDGITMTVTDMGVATAGGANPDVDVALDQITDKWETMLVNCWPSTDTAALDKYETWGAGRWGTLTKKPAIITTGSSEAIVSTLRALGDSRKTDYQNSLMPVPDSTNLPLQIAARSVVREATTANNNPPLDYAGQDLSGITPGSNGIQYPYEGRNLLVASGISTTELVDGLVTISDTVTFYHPDGEDPPAYRYVVDIVKLQNIIFNLNMIFSSQSWNGAPLIPDDQPTSNKAARKPKDAKAAVAEMLDGLGLLAIISDPAAAKKLTTAVINSGNPKRLDVSVTLQLSGNTNIISVDLLFGFFFGTAAVA